MGGYFSTRWRLEPTRATTDGVLALDVRWLNRRGSLRPGAVSTVTWTRGNDQPAGAIVTRMQRDRPGLVLDYATRSLGETEWTPRTETVWLESTPCHFGGERWWFCCPGCRRRRAVLYSVGGRFRCRACHDLAYASTREDAMDRCYRRIRALQRRLGGGGYGEPAWQVPGKPAGMHWTTYDRLAAQLRYAQARREVLFDDRLAELSSDLDRLLAQRDYLRQGRS